MPKPYLLVIFLTIGLIIIFWQPWKKRTNNKEAVIRIMDQEITAEVADIPATRSKGLMFRKSLDENKGMLFIFPNSAKHTFWMVNTYIPLDILWLNEEKEIVHIEKEVQPCTKQNTIKNLCTHYKPENNAKYVLEVNSGWVEKHNIEKGLKLKF